MSGVRLEEFPEDAELLAPYEYVAAMKQGNKRVGLVRLLARVFGVPEADGVSEAVVADVAGALQLLHNSSLIVDDVEDGTTHRRGMPAAHTKFGMAMALNAAYMKIFQFLAEPLASDAAYFSAMSRKNRNASGNEGESDGSERSDREEEEKVDKADRQRQGKSKSKNGTDAEAAARSARRTQVMMDTLVDIHRGQGADVHWRDAGKWPTVEAWCECARLKTGALFRCAVNLLRIHPAATLAREVEKNGTLDRLLRTVDEVGVIYQIMNDVANLLGVQDAEKGAVAADLDERNRTFVLALAMELCPGEKGADELAEQVDAIGAKVDADKRAILAALHGMDVFTRSKKAVGKRAAAVDADLASDKALLPLRDWFRVVMKPKQLTEDEPAVEQEGHACGRRNRSASQCITL